MKPTVKGLLVSLNTDPEVKEVENSLSALYSLLDCKLIEPGYFFRNRRIVALFDENGKDKCLPPNIILLHEGRIYDYVAGNVFFVSYDDDGNFCDLPDQILEKLKVKFGGDVHVITYGE